MPKERILVVEDSAVTAEAIESALGSFGYSVLRCAPSGESAVSAAETLRPDIVLMDLALTGEMTGVEAAAIITDQLSIPVIYLADHANQKLYACAKATKPVGIVYDPTDAVQLEMALEMALYRSTLQSDLQLALARAEEEKAKTLAVFSALGIGIAIIDVAYRVLYQNRLHQDLVGKRHFGEPCYTALNGGGPCPGCPIEIAFRTGDVETLERQVTSDGGEQFFEITASPLRNQAGEIVAGIELIRDITSRKIIEEELAESEERYRKVTELSPDAIVIHTEDSTITYANTGSGRLFRTESPGDLIGRKLFDICGGSCRDALDLVMAAHGTGDSIPLREAEVERVTGETVPVELTAVPFLHRGRRMIQTIFRDITDRKRAEETIRRMAYYDSLTGLPNRRLFDDRLRQVLAHARRHHRMFAVLFTDLDHFKKINDSLGHVAGDHLLQAVAERLITCCRREGDTVARFGGDEFTIILPDLKSRDEVVLILESLLATFASGFSIDGTTIKTTLSIGVSLYPDDGDDVHTLLIRADSSLYQAKEKGRATYSFYENPATGRAAAHV